MNKAEADVFARSVASGLICGEGIWSMPQSVLALAKAQPPICMKFLSRSMNARVDTIQTVVKDILFVFISSIRSEASIISLMAVDILAI